MIREDLEPGDIKQKVQDLAKAMNDIRTSQADRDDVVVELKHAKLSRLELLVEELKPVINDIPENCDRFEFVIARGNAPRLWVDMTTFVRLAGDGSEYELVKDTRMGRQIIAREASRTEIGNQVTSYVAERLLERERMLEGDWITDSQKQDDAKEASQSLIKEDTQAKNETVALAGTDTGGGKAGFVNQERHSSLSLLLWFLLGLVGGGLILFALFSFGMADKLVEMVVQ